MTNALIVNACLPVVSGTPILSACPFPACPRPGHNPGPPTAVKVISAHPLRECLTRDARHTPYRAHVLYYTSRASELPQTMATIQVAKASSRSARSPLSTYSLHLARKRREQRTG